MFSIEERPFSFHDMVGQKGIRSELLECSKDNSFPSVMIFSGPTGTGKTTSAFITAALLNDKNPIIHDDGTKSPNPESSVSKSILNERFIGDVRFYDASGMGKDDVLKLEDQVSHNPTIYKNTVVIIDEAQELSHAGKGAVLKLLEKKRKNVYFILCTMNINSLDKAVQSRGSLYNFRKINAEDTSNYLFNLLDKIGKLDEVPEYFLEKGLFLVAENADGSVRQAVQNLERCLKGKFFTEKEINKEFNFISQEKLQNVVFQLLNKEESSMKNIVDLESEIFYLKSFVILSDAIKYKYNKNLNSKDKWKEPFLKKIFSHPNLKSLYGTYITMRNNGLFPKFNEPIFIYYLDDYLDKKVSIKPEDEIKVKSRRGR
jgi:DNA polymerase III gamma/tau subunit